MSDTPLGNAIDFFRDFGLFDVLLPFLLIFSITFAILEKTMILGKEGKKGEELPKRSLNATVAFVVAMLVVATNKVVTVINKALPNVLLLVVGSFAFLLMIGIFYQEGEFNFAKNNTIWLAIFLGILFIALILIFLNALTNDAGISWLELMFGYIVNNFSGTIVSSLVILVVPVGAIIIIVKPNVFKGRGSGGDDNDPNNP